MTAYLALGELPAAREHLRACLDVALEPIDNATLRKVGSIAAAEELFVRVTANHCYPAPTSRRHSGAASPVGVNAEDVARWVY